MKTRFIIGSVLVVGILQAGQPQPPVVIYGQIRDEMGYPMDQGATVAVLDLSRSSNECGAYTLAGDIQVGINYRISLPLEDAEPIQRERATTEGSQARMVIRVEGIEQEITPAGDFAVPQPGDAVRMDFSIAKDSDGDGLPDTWEEMMILWSGGVFSSIEDIDPDADTDGDGMSNRDEYLAGTFPFSATDLFEITRSELNPDTGRIALTFTTEDRRQYHVLVSGVLADGTWMTAASSATESSELKYQVIAGTGREVTVYVDGSYDFAFFKVGAD